jgi:hypothetical protein
VAASICGVEDTSVLRRRSNERQQTKVDVLVSSVVARTTALLCARTGCGLSSLYSRVRGPGPYRYKSVHDSENLGKVRAMIVYLVFARESYKKSGVGWHSNDLPRAYRDKEFALQEIAEHLIKHPNHPVSYRLRKFKSVR